MGTNNRQNGAAAMIRAKIEFWKGMMLGIVAGMAVAAYACSVADRIPDELKKDLKKSASQLNPKPGRIAAA
jgi:hypothetical protein